ncbi:MAG TPA: PASTA domain-containing protein [Candidatus Hydrogenedentes bacterium]|nr:PASTA domain-containing protein [Candidatus Hydrogenedentota bacterium]
MHLRNITFCALAAVFAAALPFIQAQAQESCPAGSIFSQTPALPTDSPSPRVWVNDDFWGPGNGTAASAYDYFSVADRICGVTWWGTELSTMTLCATERTAPTFTVTFFTDDTSSGSSMPGSVVCQYTVTATKENTGLIYANTLNPGCPQLPLYRYSADLATCCNLTSGWITVRGTAAGSANGAVFVPVSNYELGATMCEYNGTDLPYRVRTGDNRSVSFCLTTRLSVPDVVGLAQAAAESAITGAGLTVGTVTTDYSMTVPAGDVISQDPAAGSDAVPGDAVSIVVSLGVPTLVTVPDVLGMTVADATTALQAAGLALGTVTEQYSSEPVGAVISQTPDANEDAPLNSSVNLVVSKGEAPPMPVSGLAGLAAVAAALGVTGALRTRKRG